MAVDHRDRRRKRDPIRNQNNRWQVAAKLNRRFGKGSAGPFWGCPPRQTNQWLTSRRKGIFEFPYSAQSGLIEQKRIAERRFRKTQEAWKLLGAGSVGSQALLGIPYLEKLRNDFRDSSLVWPFETGFSKDPVGDRRPLILHAEIWPGLVEDAVQERLAEESEIRDQAQMMEMCTWAERHDKAGTIGSYFDEPKSLPAGEMKACVEEEGWILGTPAPDAAGGCL